MIKSPIVTTILVILAVIAIAFIVSTQWFKNLFSSGLKEGDSCTLPDSTKGIISNGQCKAIILPPVDPDPNVAERLPLPSIFRLRRSGSCQQRITLAQYPGYVWTLYASNFAYCYYKRV